MTTVAHRHLRVVHRLRRRVRLIAQPLLRSSERCYVVEILLRKRPEIKAVRAVPEIGSLAVHYDPGRLPEVRLLAIVDGLLANLLIGPPAAATSAPAAAPAPLQETLLAISGMSCVSCALLIELALRRDRRVELANVNFAAQSAVVRGTISREEVFALVKQLGYQAQGMDTLAQRRLLVECETERLALARKRLLAAAALSAPVMLVGRTMHRSLALRGLELALTTAVLFGPGREIFDRAWRLARQKSANMDSLIALGAGAAYLYSLPGLLRPAHPVYFEAAAGTLSFVLLGRYLEERAKR